MSALEVRFDGPPHPRPPVRGELAVLLDGVALAPVTAMDVALRGHILAPDAADSVARLIDRLPALRHVTVSIGGPPRPADVALAADLSERSARRRLTFAVDLLVDENADAFAPLPLAPVLDASRRLRAASVKVRWIVPITPALIYRLEGVFSLARDEGVEPVVSATRGADPALSHDDRLFLSDFITYRLLDEERQLHTQEQLDEYRAIQAALDRPGRFAPAMYHRVAVLSGTRGDDGLRWELEHMDRPRVDVPTDWRVRQRKRLESSRPGQLVAGAIGLSGVLVEGGQALARWGRARVAPAAPRAARFARVLLIGAYGGEHIGDAAILGGVLFRINRRYGTTEAILMSQRPAHTRHLIPMLDTPFTLEVEAYEQPRIRECMRRVDAVVFAGGPLIDLPKQLVKHLYTASLAREAGKPFIAEGIGPGPFPRWPSEWTARRLVCMADRISVRTSTDAGARVVSGLTPEIGHDPAFDYLATRGAELSRLRDRDRSWIRRLLDDTAGRLLIGLNVRPIRHLFTVGGPAMKREEYTRAIEARFEERLAEGMRRFHQASPVRPCFVYFPMNAIQFGSSDLRSAYRLQRQLRGDVDFRVWQDDASLDGVIALLRRLDIVIAMRFHATIFALSQERRVLGIDYRIGERDKVGALLADVGQSENCTRIDELTPEWILERLSALSPAPAGG